MSGVVYMTKCRGPTT